MGPPLVDVIDRAVDFLPPAFTFCDSAEALEREIVVFDGAGRHRPNIGMISRDRQWFQV